MQGRDAFAVLMGGTRRGPAPPTKPAAARRAQAGGSRATQLHLDLGQVRRNAGEGTLPRDFAVATCAVCGMMYGKGLPEEERLHDHFHNTQAAVFRFPGWTSERVLQRDGGRARLLCCLPADPWPQRKKVSEVCAQLDRILGVPQGYLLAPDPPYKVFLWVSGEAAAARSAKGRIVGVLVAQLQQRARRCSLEAAATQQLQPQPQQPQPAQQEMSVVLLPAASGLLPAAMAAQPGLCEPDDVASGSSRGCKRSRSEQQGVREASPRTARPAAGNTAAAHASTTETGGQEGDGQGEGGRPDKRRRRQVGCAASEDEQGGSGGAGSFPQPGDSARRGRGGGGAAASALAEPSRQCAAAGGPATARGCDAAATGPPAAAAARPDACAAGCVAGCVLGVRGIWVEPLSRRRGIARQMLDAARCCMVPGVLAERGQVAFSACSHAAATGEDAQAFSAFVAAYKQQGSGVGGALGERGAGRTVLLYDDDGEGDVEEA
ncbi:N-acetyltransferase ESCO1 [Tetrabaena socialis]|uniref:N-acetyltransferase ESCO1 n=1 Tax=Tetrabaena socialis TaxID=47790 RepID=A0A2J7ZTF2_9CHLO|nr:N-acetyltransferase ESCO1 [Tetrabaena socialis]|eukprot:PNH03551.1 N-acetyltransferase ESCO1 [Tetrabaena socialis]